MRRVVFAGCSFTHSGESWAYQGQPNVRPRVEEIDPNPGSWGKRLLREQYENYMKKYGHCENLHPDIFWNNSKQLSKDEFEINIFGRGSNSNTDTARCIMHFIENYEHDIDTVVMQLSGFSRRELFTSSQEAIDHANTFSGYDKNVTTYDDANFIKHWGAVDYNEVLEENPPPDSVRKASAYFYSVINEPEEYHIRAIEQLQSLTNFCKVNNIKLGYFHGWDNLPKEGGNTDYKADFSDHEGVNTLYFNKKYDKYVKPHLISNHSIISYAEEHLEPSQVYDLHTTERNLGFEPGVEKIHHGGHPCPLAHQLYWNEIVYPFVV